MRVTGDKQKLQSHCSHSLRLRSCTEHTTARGSGAEIVATDSPLLLFASYRYGDSLWHSLLTVLSAVVVDFLLLGCAVATAGW